jgi:hypothetical protein
MARSKCPMCHTPCIVKIIATEDERYREVDVCQMCGAMYPHEGKAASAKRVSKGPLPRPRGKAKPGKKAKRAGKPKKRKAKAKPRKKAVRKAKRRAARRR